MALLTAPSALCQPAGVTLDVRAGTETQKSLCRLVRTGAYDAVVTPAGLVATCRDLVAAIGTCPATLVTVSVDPSAPLSARRCGR